MKFAEDLNNDGNHITAYDAHSISVNGQRHQASLILCADHLDTAWAVSHIDQLDAKALKPIDALKPELVIIGTGARLSFPPAQCYAALAQQNIGVEFMDTGAACRTYNILLSEGRRVVAGLIINKVGSSQLTVGS